MSKDRLSLDETIKQLDKRNTFTVKELTYHLDVVAEYTKLYEETNLLRYKVVAVQSRQIIINAFEQMLKDKRQ